MLHLRRLGTWEDRMGECMGAEADARLGHAPALLPGEHHPLIRSYRELRLELLDGSTPDLGFTRFEQRQEGRECLEFLCLAAQGKHPRLRQTDFQPRSLSALKQVRDSLGPRNASRLDALVDEEDRCRYAIALEDRIGQVEIVGKAIVERDGDRATWHGAPFQDRLDDLVQRQHPVVERQVGDLGRKLLLRNPGKEWIFPGDDAMETEDD